MSNRSLLGLVAILSLVLGFVGGGTALVLLPTIIPSLDAPAHAPTSVSSSASSFVDDGTVQVVRQTSPAVVSIVATHILDADGISGNFFDPFSGSPSGSPQMLGPHMTTSSVFQPQETGAGSGFFVSSTGIIATNRHVVDDSRATYTVVLQDGSRHQVHVLAIDTVFDLAFLKIDQVNGTLYPVLTLGDSDRVEVGEPVIAIGNALAQFQNTVTKGVVSGVHRRLVAGTNEAGSEVLEEAIQTDAAINPGNSGGPLVDLRGQVIGINTAISEDAQSLGFALPVSEVKRALDSLETHGHIVRPWLGVRYTIITPELAAHDKLTHSYGARVEQGDTESDVAVMPGSPADKAGLRVNDIILELDHQIIDEDHSLSDLLLQHDPGAQVVLHILRQGKEQDVTVTLAERKTGQ